jgi:hypothetical protein
LESELADESLVELLEKELESYLNRDEESAPRPFSFSHKGVITRGSDPEKLPIF